MHLPSRRPRAFTLVEVSVATAIFAMLGLVVYGVASEGLFAFSRNISINRSYGEARRALERIGSALGTAGYQPQLLDGNGAALLNTDGTVNTVGPAAGIRFWRYGSASCYNVTTPLMTDTSLVLSLYKPDTVSGTPVLQPPPAVNDLITITAIGFQARAVSVASVSSSSVRVSFFNNNPVSTYTTVTSIPAQTSPPPPAQPTTIQYSCLDWTSQAIIAVGTQLRYYPTFIPGTTAINTPANYKVLANLTAAVGGNTTPLPFSMGPSPSVNVDLYAEAPDYNNRTRDISSANTYTFLSTAFSPRNPTLLASPYTSPN